MYIFVDRGHTQYVYMGKLSIIIEKVACASHQFPQRIVISEGQLR